MVRPLYKASYSFVAASGRGNGTFCAIDRAVNRSVADIRDFIVLIEAKSVKNLYCSSVDRGGSLVDRL